MSQQGTNGVPEHFLGLQHDVMEYIQHVMG